jgi:hypothetical protein
VDSAALTPTRPGCPLDREGVGFVDANATFGSLS